MKQNNYEHLDGLYCEKKAISFRLLQSSNTYEKKQPLKRQHYTPPRSRSVMKRTKISGFLTP